MSVSSKIFEALTQAIKMTETVARLAEETRNVAKDVREMDKRLVRLEAFIEMAMQQQKLSKLPPN